MDIHQRENGRWCYVDYQQSVGYDEYTPMAAWIGQFDTRQEAVLAGRLKAAEADARECRAERARYSDIVAGNMGALENEVERTRLLLAAIAELVSWHMDTEADPDNESPKDQVAHVNGLVWQLCQDQEAQAQ